MTAVHSPVVAGQAFHPMMARPTHDDLSRQLFMQSLMGQVNGPLAAANTAVWNARTGAAFRKTHGRDPNHVSEVRKALLREPYTQYWSALRRTGREMIYEAVGPMVERQLPALVEKARRYAASPCKIGGLALDSSLPQPRYMSEVENHGKPGGYHSELTEDDVFAGAEFDRSFHVGGQRPNLVDTAGTAAKARIISSYGPLADGLGAALAGWAKENLRDLKPKRILDMGCTVGNSTLPWVDVYPGAEVHAIDTAAPCLRYAHARAEALGKRVLFAQQNAEATRYEGASFDLVLSHQLLHELTVTSIDRVFAECHRLLKPGGVMMHLDIPPAADMDMVSQWFHLDWNAHFNAEPFMTTLSELDLGQVAAKGGFAANNTFHAYAKSVAPESSATFHFFGARK